MEKMKKFLEKRKVYLSRLKKTKENALKSAPEGSLRLCNRKNKAQYYWRTDPKDSSGIYIPEKDIKLARKLITPIIETDEQYIHSWESVVYQGKGFGERFIRILQCYMCRIGKNCIGNTWG